ncbi:MAG: sulfatase [Candidatus Nealsonbacteria bacterium]|nr:sulfatase [Candidatus Nealsonbacteria bacterium]
MCSRKHPAFLAWTAVAIGLAVACRASAAEEDAADGRPPNFVIILCDNLGYGDVGCYGSKVHRTPHVDRMAAEGMRFTDFYVSSGVCTPSRASLMTGCYPRRVNMHVSSQGLSVLRPADSKGLHPAEITIAEILRDREYATACIGKWHLGDQPSLLPTRQGFDLYHGVPYSDDMTARPGKPWPPLPLMRGDRVIEAPADRNLLTRRYTDEAIRFITANRARPWFVLLAHAMPGSTQRPFASETFRGKSANGAYGDAVEEIDWSTGRILATLEQLDLDRQTLVLWTSDNGAPRRNPPQGSNRPLGGWGYTTAEGGMRVPCIVRWPGRVPAGTTCRELATTMDLLPTFTRLAGSGPPTDRIIDGKDIWPLLAGEPAARSPHEAFYYYHIAKLQAVRSGRWKLHLSPQRLFDLQTDIGETTNVAADHGEIVRRLEALAERAREDLGDTGRNGKNQRPAGTVPDPKPQRISAN